MPAHESAAGEPEAIAEADAALHHERRHLAEARAALQRMREHTAGLKALGGDHVSTEHLKQVLYRRMKALQDDPTVPLFFGRLDYDTTLGAEHDETLYIGRRHVTGEIGRRAAGDRLAGRDVAALLPGPARGADGRPVASPVRLLPRAADRVRGRGPRHGRRRVGSGVGDPGVRDRASPDRPDARHRGHHPAGAGPHRPGRADRLALRPGRPRHRQDGGRAAPCGLPAVRLPGPARPLRRAGGRPERQLPVLHRRRAPRAGRDRRHPGDGVLPGHRGHRCRDPRARPGARGVDQGRRRGWPRCCTGPSGATSAARPRRWWCRAVRTSGGSAATWPTRSSTSCTHARRPLRGRAGRCCPSDSPTRCWSGWRRRATPPTTGSRTPSPAASRSRRTRISSGPRSIRASWCCGC